ncbi:MAG: RNA polymerase sigma factor [Planctomycetota bacterium]
MAKDPQRNTSKDVEAALTPEALIEKFASAVLGLCIAHTKNFHDGEDVMQEVFMKAFTKFGTLRDPTRARSWLLKIARRMCIDFTRRRSPAQPMPENVPAPPHGQDEQINRLHKAISRLPEGYREPITLYYLDGRNCAGVAQNLGISEEAVRSRLVRARLRLHEILKGDKS